VFLIGHQIRAALWITGLPANLFHGLLLWTVCTRVELELPACGNHGMRRTHPWRHKDILKRQLIHVGGVNLSLILGQLQGPALRGSGETVVSRFFCSFISCSRTRKVGIGSTRPEFSSYRAKGRRGAAQSSTPPAVPKMIHLRHGLLN
jgi:hypothetical protein